MFICLLFVFKLQPANFAEAPIQLRVLPLLIELGRAPLANQAGLRWYRRWQKIGLEFKMARY
jgi:hypothetical protein